MTLFLPRIRSWILALTAAAFTFATLAGSQTAEAAATSSSGDFHVAGKWIVDGQGRVVTLHGFDIMAKLSPYYPANFTAKDAAFLASEGFTTARIGFIWAGVEPKPGVYDNSYIRHVLNLAALLERYGIHPLIDFHQDDYGTWDQKCAAQGDCNILSGDGAPSWAQLCPGTTAPWDCDFQQFWDNKPATADGVGIQTLFISAWAHVARMLDASPVSKGVLGLDPFNEPYPGSGYPAPCADFEPCPRFEETQLHAFYVRVIASLRSVGDRHIIFPEAVAQNALATPSLPKFSDPDTGFNWHYYGSPSDVQAHDNVLEYTQALDKPWLVSEFAGDGAEVDWLDSHFLSWMAWMYYNATNEPADVPGEGLLLDDGLGGSEANANQAKLNAMDVPYAAAIAGHPEIYAYDRSSHTLRLTYRASAVRGTRLAPGALTSVWIPVRQYPDGYYISLRNGTVTTRFASSLLTGSRWIQIHAAPGRQVSMAICPTDTGVCAATPRRIART